MGDEVVELVSAVNRIGYEIASLSAKMFEVRLAIDKQTQVMVELREILEEMV